jgi:hypothetical protein
VSNLEADTGEQTPDIEAVLAAHRYQPGTPFMGLVFPVACGCGERTPGWTAYEAHVAQAFAPVLDAAVREARAAELREAADELGSESRHPWVLWARDHLLDRADRIAVDAPVCVHCGAPVRATERGDDWIHANNLHRCQSPDVAYGHLAHPAGVPCRADGPNPCLGAFTDAPEGGERR